MAVTAIVRTAYAHGSGSINMRGKGFCIGGEAEERAESSVAGFAAVEAKDELIEIGLQMLATRW